MQMTSDDKLSAGGESLWTNVILYTILLLICVVHK